MKRKESSEGLKGRRRTWTRRPWSRRRRRRGGEEKGGGGRGARYRLGGDDDDDGAHSSPGRDSRLASTATATCSS